MTIPAAFTTALATDAPSSVWYLEIEGLPYAYGNTTCDGSWFTSMGATAFLGVKPWGVGRFPELGAAEVGHKEGRVSVGDLRVSIVDLDDTLAGYAAVRRTDQWVRVSGNVYDGGATKVREFPATALSWDASGDDTSWLTAGAIAWIGTEAVEVDSYAAGLLTLTRRAMYRSQAQRIRTPFVAQGSSQVRLGAVITPYPRSLVGRRCWLRWGLNATSDDDCVDVFAGVITDTGWEQRGQTLVIRADDVQATLKRPIFTELRRPFGRGVADGAPIRLVGAIDPTPTASGTAVLAANELDTDAFADPVHVESGGAIYELTYVSSDTIAATFTVREVWRRGDVVDPALRAGDVVTPIALVAEYGSGLYAGVKFTAGDHPLQVLLQVLTSTGEGTNGTYDVLPASWGLAVPQSDVDVAGIERLADATAGLAMFLPVLDAVPDAREWLIASCLRPWGFYLRPRLGKALSVGTLDPPKPEAVADAVSITTTDLVIDGAGQAVQAEGPELQQAPIIGGVSVAGPIGFVDGKWEAGQPVTIRAWDEDATAETADLYRDAPIVEIPLLPVRPSAPGDDQSRAVRAAARLMRALFGRYGYPPALYRVQVWLERCTLDVGDLALLTLANVPSAFSATRGLTAEAMEVWQKRIDVGRGIVELTLAQTWLTRRAVRNLAPALYVTAWNDGTKTATVSENRYSSGGSYDDTSAFAVGDVVRVYSGDLSSRSSTATVQSKTSTSVELSKNAAALGVTPASGYTVIHADYGEVGAAVLAKYAFRAGSDEKLGTADAPHVYG